MKVNLEFDEELHQYKVDGKPVPSVTEIVGLLTSKKYEINKSVLERAAHRGTIVHELCELLDYDSLPEEIDPECEGFLVAYQKFLNDYQPNWLFIEKQLTNGAFAGTVDRVGVIDGNLVVVDLKTTASMDRISKISLICQLEGYAELLEDQLDIVADINRSFGVQLKKDGTYVIHNVAEISKKYGINEFNLFSDLFVITNIIRGEN